MKILIGDDQLKCEINRLKKANKELRDAKENLICSNLKEKNDNLKELIHPLHEGEEVWNEDGTTNWLHIAHCQFKARQKLEKENKELKEENRDLMKRKGNSTEYLKNALNECETVICAWDNYNDINKRYKKLKKENDKLRSDYIELQEIATEKYQNDMSNNIIMNLQGQLKNLKEENCHLETSVIGQDTALKILHKEKDELQELKWQLETKLTNTENRNWDKQGKIIEFKSQLKEKEEEIQSLKCKNHSIIKSARKHKNRVRELENENNFFKKELILWKNGTPTLNDYRELCEFELYTPPTRHENKTPSFKQCKNLYGFDSDFKKELLKWIENARTNLSQKQSIDITNTFIIQSNYFLLNDIERFIKDFEAKGDD